MLKIRFKITVILALLLAVGLVTEVSRAESQYGLRRAPRVKPARTLVYAGLKAGTVMVKFRDDLGVYAQSGRLYYRDGRPVEAINSLFDRGVVVRAEPEFDLDKATLLAWRREGELRAGIPLADLSAYFRLELASDQDLAAAGRVTDLINRSPDVELAFLEGRPEVAGDIEPATPDYEPTQDYLKPAPGGVDAYGAWGYAGGRGEGVKVCDIEYGWQTDHEDLSRLVGGIIGGDPGPHDHGTAVMGEMFADSAISDLTAAGYGVTGICHGAEARMVSVSYRSTADALVLAAQNLAVGDLILIELHQPGPNSTGSGQFGYVPMEWTPSIFDVIQTITANGIVVCEAAGNGSQNLDDPVYSDWFDTTVQHSGAIMCGAGAPPSGIYGPDRSRLSYSNYGMRVDLQGYGYGVVTTGYGGLFDPGDPRQWYTATFSGTSSASPIVTGSVACIQGRFKQISGGYTMTGKEIRDLLYATGSPQTTNAWEHIGPRPNLGAAMPLVLPLSAYVNPRTFNISLLSPPVVIDTLWLVNPHAAATDFSIAIVDSLPSLPQPTAASNLRDKDALLAARAPAAASVVVGDWLAADPAVGTVPAGESLAVAVTFDGNELSGSYFGSFYKGRLDVTVDGPAGITTIPVPVLAMAQDSLHGDTIEVVTAAVTHIATSETNMHGWTYNDDPVSAWLYDGSFLVGLRAAGDTTVYRDVFGNARLWRGRDWWQADSSWWPGYVVWRDSSITEDSLFGLRYEAWVPVSGDSAEFVYWRVTLYGRVLLYAGVTFGIVGDWDLPSSSGADNFGAFDETRQMIYQTGNAGYENNAAGYALLRRTVHSAVIGSNPDDVYPNGGFTDGRLYQQMYTPGYRVDAANDDLHAILTPYLGTVGPATPQEFELVTLSSRTGLPGLEAAYARAEKLSDSLRYLSCPIIITGDVNVDGLLNSTDIIQIVNYVFKGGPAPLPIPLAADVDCSGAVVSADIIYMVNHVFKSGPAPCDACTLY